MNMSTESSTKIDSNDMYIHSFYNKLFIIYINYYL